MSCKPRTNRIGEKRMQNCGLEAEIIEYHNNRDVNIRFPDGIEIAHRRYEEFKRGSICHPNIGRYKMHMKKRIGEKHMQNCGLEAEIIGYRNSGNIDVRFPDGTIVEHRGYNKFTRGLIAHPNINQYKKQANERIGEIRMQNCGHKAEITEYRNAGDIDIEFPDGATVEHRTYTDFTTGSINHPNIDRYKRHANERIGEKHMQNCGLKAEIIGYRNSEDIDIRFPDGTIVEHKRYCKFMNKSIGHPTINAPFNNNIGKIYPKGRSKIYHTEIHGIAYIIDDTYYYFCHCPICQAHEIWTFNEIKSHKCNQKLAEERDEYIQTLKTQSNAPAT